jgi:nucleoside-diphosphate-sugar epimerase
VDPARIERPAVEGTLNALAAARRQGVERIVYTSTAATKVRGKLGERAAPDPGWA